MRMNPEQSLTAKEIINSWSEKALGDLFRDLGEEMRFKRIARAIVETRKRKKFQTTTDLVQAICAAAPGKIRGKLHPATLVFQALRLAVNSELDTLGSSLEKAISLLKPKGRIAVIAFHRLEDRIVKNVFRTASKQEVRLLTKKPLVPTWEEIKGNVRARSAKLRALEKMWNEDC